MSSDQTMPDTPDETASTTRRYESPLRREQAQQTERKMLDAAHRLLVERGYASMTMAAVATEAGVSSQTVYKVFGTKSALVKRLWDVTLAGDQEPVPLAQRPGMRQIWAEPDPRRKVALLGQTGSGLYGRLGGLYSQLLAGAQSGDADLRELVATSERERRIDIRAVVEHLALVGALRTDISVQRATDIVWVLTAPEPYLRFLDRCGWSQQEFEDWFTHTVAASILADGKAAAQTHEAG